MSESGIYIVEGEGGQDWLKELVGVEHLGSETVLGGSFGDGVGILNASGDCLGALLGHYFRQKRSFAVSGLESLSLEAVVRLCATARRRKSNSVLLGGFRVLPPFSALKEILACGCLGDVNSLELEHCGGDDWRMSVLVKDVGAWLSQGRGECVVLSGGPGFRVRLACSSGSAEGAWELDGSGYLETTVGGHRRVRRYGHVDSRMMEISLLECGSGKLGAVSCLIPLRGLSVDVQES